MAKILIIEDEENLRFTIKRTLNRGGHETGEAATLASARKLLQAAEYDMVLTDISLGAENGLDLVRDLRAEAYDGVIVVMTAFSTVETAVNAMRLGADDYLQKPISMEELSLQVEKWLEHRRLAKRVRLYERLEQSRDRDHEALGDSPAWKSVLGLATRLSAIPLSGDGADGTGNAPLPCILLTGETGAGKGVLARHIHSQAEAHAARQTGKSASAPFVHVNCSALPANLVEGELFGHEKGAFTDAREARAGLFEMADGGTIFLDEISEMPLDLQAKLLLVVESGRFRRVGGTKERTVRVRVIAASNQKLEERVAAGAFRRDLLYRLNAFTVRIPPLRERGGDAVLIAQTMIDRLAKRYGRSGLSLSPASTRAISAHDWPGNVRELVNAVQRAVMLCESDRIEPEDLGLSAEHAEHTDRDPGAEDILLDAGDEHALPHAANGKPRGSGDLVFDFVHGVHKAAEVEKELVMQALRFTHGNVSRAARLIGMQRSSLRYRIERYRLDAFVMEVANQ